jgi:hypothetical protein
MGGGKKHRNDFFETGAARRCRDGAFSYKGRSPTGKGMMKQTSGAMSAVITQVVAEIIGRRVILHELLGAADFASIYAGKEGSRPLWRYRYDSETPFGITLLSHKVLYSKRQLTIFSDGYLKPAHGKGLPLMMEVCVDKAGVSQSGAANQKEEKRSLTLRFDYGPATFFETAFSFDIIKNVGSYGVTGCGFVGFSDWSG